MNSVHYINLLTALAKTRFSLSLSTLVRTLCNRYSRRSMFFILCINKKNVLMSAHAASNWKKEKEMNENMVKNECISNPFLGRPQKKKKYANWIVLGLLRLWLPLCVKIHVIIGYTMVASSWIGIYWTLSCENHIKDDNMK